MKRKLRTGILLILLDFFVGIFSWAIFFTYRKVYIEKLHDYKFLETFQSERYWLGAFAISIFWIGLYAIHGLYNNVLRKSRLREFTLALWISIIGSTAIFFFFLLDDFKYSYTDYYSAYLALFLIHISLSIPPKLIINTIIARKVHRKQISFNTLFIGGNENALELYNRLENAKKSAGYNIVGFLQNENGDNAPLTSKVPLLGDYSRIKEIINSLEIEDLIIALNENDQQLYQIIAKLGNTKVNIKVLPNMTNILVGQVKMSSILHEALIEIQFGAMPYWQLVTKRFLDIVISILVLTICSPLYLLLAILVKFSSKGPIFFKQLRIGKNGKPFYIYKFRSMYTDAEKKGPELSKDDDSRITPIGKFLRKSRMDELPQFYNVLISDMSIVGPRPERQFFIDQIVERAPEYHYLNTVKPGITSWGQVKFGYAENVDEMLERLKFDLLYIENMSLIVDFKIIIHTILVVLQGRGK